MFDVRSLILNQLVVGQSKEPSPVCTAVLYCLYKIWVDFTVYYLPVMFPLSMPCLKD